MKKSIEITPIKTTKVNGIHTAATKIKFTKDETRYAMSLAMKYRKLLSKKHNVSFNSIPLGDCLKEGYRRVTEMKIYKSNLVSYENRKLIKDSIKKEFGYGSIDALIKKENVDTMKAENFLQGIILSVAILDNKRRVDGKVFSNRWAL